MNLLSRSYEGVLAWAGSGPFFAIPPPFGVQVYQTEGLALFTHLRGRTILRSSSSLFCELRLYGVLSSSPKGPDDGIMFVIEGDGPGFLPATQKGEAMHKMRRARQAERHEGAAPGGAAPVRGASGVRAGGHGLGWTSLGALAIGASAAGAVAIGALAIRELAVKRGRIQRSDIEELEVERLHVRELVVEQEQKASSRTGASSSLLHSQANRI